MKQTEKKRDNETPVLYWATEWKQNFNEPTSISRIQRPLKVEACFRLIHDDDDDDDDEHHQNQNCTWGFYRIWP